MKREIQVMCISLLFVFLWGCCFGSVYNQSVRFSPVCRTAWTLRVVKVVDHIVKKGESLTKIAKKYGVELQDILKANGIDDPENIQAGEKIRVPLKKVKGEVLI